MLADTGLTRPETAPEVPPPPAWSQRIAALGNRFYTELPPSPAPAPHWVARSEACAQTLGWAADWWQQPGALEVFSGNALWPGMRPLASVYSGHQFGVWAGQLGDGRALSLGETMTPQGLWDVQLKGAGLTPYSRMGDGRAVLRSSIREFLCSEAMHALGIPTTRALCITGSPLGVRREEMETAAIVTRVAPSFLRFGHFEHFAHTANGDQHAALRELADFMLQHHAPECLDAANPVLALLEKVARQTAELMADWQAVGFCHGVMNTDNMSMLGLTLDYGPFGFLDAFDPGHVCNHSDHQGRYAYARQPNVAFWNLHALAQALLPLLNDDSEAAIAALEPYKTVFPEALMRRMRAKLGLATEQDADRVLVDDLLRLMATARADFTITFRRLSRFDATDEASRHAVRDLFLDRETFDDWALRYQDRLAQEGSVPAERHARMLATNPAVVLRNHLAEQAIRQAREGDFSEVERLLKVLASPYDEPAVADYAAFPPDWAQHLEVSCSS
nr:YdiU family protein [uncultured Roseateles sp.]